MKNYKIDKQKMLNTNKNLITEQKNVLNLKKEIHRDPQPGNIITY